MSIRSTKNKISQIKAELLKSAFTPMPPDQQQQGAPAGGAPAPQGGAAPAPQGGQPPAAPPQGGGGVIEQLQAQGIDANQLMQDPNMLQQVAQQFGADPNALAQAIQQEMQAMGGGDPAAAGGPPPEGDPAAAGGPPPEIQELYAGVEQLMQAMQSTQEENAQLRQQLMNVEGQIQGLASQVDKVMSLIDETSGVPENAY